MKLAIPAAVATTSQNHHGRKSQPLLGLKTTDSNIMESMPQKMVITNPAAMRLQIFIFLFMFHLTCLIIIKTASVYYEPRLLASRR